MMNAEHLIRWGYVPGKWFHHAIMEAERARRRGASHDEILVLVTRLAKANELEAAGVHARRSGDQISRASRVGD